MFTELFIFFSFADMADENKNKGFRRFGRHYLLLLWKNFILARRTLVRTLFEITLPVFFGFLLLAIRHIVKSETFPDGRRYEPFHVDELPKFSTVKISDIAYAPNTSFTNNVMKRAAARLGLEGTFFDT